jgi:hypothetical protein
MAIGSTTGGAPTFETLIRSPRSAQGPTPHPPPGTPPQPPPDSDQPAPVIEPPAEGPVRNRLPSHRLAPESDPL